MARRHHPLMGAYGPRFGQHRRFHPKSRVGDLSPTRPRCRKASPCCIVLRPATSRPPHILIVFPRPFSPFSPRPAEPRVRDQGGCHLTPGGARLRSPPPHPPAFRKSSAPTGTSPTSPTKP